ncbi:thioredoxin-like protein [Amanita rubescens]|nr:thioredoxin-like protein [Amanita rubescens]
MLSRLYNTLFSRQLSSTAFQSNSNMASVKSFVESTIGDNKVVIFSKTYCPYCKEVKALFKSKYPEEKPVVVELDERDDGSKIQDYLVEKSGQRTVPNVFINKEHVGGSDNTHSAHNNGKLKQLLSA